MDIVKRRGLILHFTGAVDPRVGDRRMANLASTEGAGRGHPRTLCVQAACGRDLALVPTHTFYVPGRGCAPCLTIHTQGRVGAGAVLDPRAVEGGVTAKTMYKTATASRDLRGIGRLYFPIYPIYPLSTSCVLHDP